MHVVITMAGQSRRFVEQGYRTPKALLNCGERMMIDHVVRMFDPNRDHFHVVVNESQITEIPSLREELESLAARVSVIVVPSHERGPAYSALHVTGIGNDEEVIISYCDFIIGWDYASFLRHAYGNDGAILSFRGFHPASFGDTFYAYIRQEDDRFIELREKRPYTEDRTSEHASTGVYYFAKWSIFREYAQRVLDKNELELPEAYVSLLYNEMFREGLDIVIHEARKFICLGTPNDYDQYQYWWRYFNCEQVQHHDPGRGVQRVGIIPMGGQGTRFRDFGYRVAKPLISVIDQPMVARTLQSMPETDRWSFVVRALDLRRYPIERTLKNTVQECTIVALEGDTSGQAATCLLAARQLAPDAELLIASCDYEHRFDPIAWQAVLDDSDIDGAIWTYRSKGIQLKDPAAFAYCVTDESGETVTRVVEKRTISDEPEKDPLVVGTFWYRRAEDFFHSVDSMIEKRITVNNEHYIGTSVNQLIDEGKRIISFEVDQWISYGDPFELQVLEYWQDYFTHEGALNTLVGDGGWKT